MKIIYLNLLQVQSTNVLLKNLVGSLKKEHLTVLSARYQYAGHGTFGKSWLSSENNLTFSMAFFINHHKAESTDFLRTGAEAIVDVLKAKNIKNIRIKWPNDVMVDDHKIAGILCETRPYQDYLCIIVGIGMNINSDERFLRRISQPATSILQLTGNIHSIAKIKEQIAESFLQKIEKNLKLSSFSS